MSPDQIVYTNNGAEVRFDTDKDASNLRKHGLSLSSWDQVDWLFAEEDNRKDYGETRYRIIGLWAARPYMAVLATRGREVRIISLRPMHSKEYKRYARQITP